MKKPASDLHDVQAQVYLKVIQEMLDGAREVDPKLLESARNFLKDNGITERMDHESNTKKLAEQLPDMPFDNDSQEEREWNLRAAK